MEGYIMGRNYWGYRIDKNKARYFMSELENGRLRQGWGFDPGQDLRDFKVDKGARRNKKMFEQVKQGDVLVVPRLPKWGQVALVQATQDWSVGYYFSIDPDLKDYGHVFPAKFLVAVDRNNEYVTGNIRASLRNPSRFWKMSRYAEELEKLVEAPPEQLSRKQSFRARYQDRLSNIVGDSFNKAFADEVFRNHVYEEFNRHFAHEEWEFALVEGLRKLFPFYTITREGGRTEKEHGTDILIRMPSLLSDYEYAIAIQVKDYENVVAGDAIRQINKADEYWESENLKLVDKWLVVTRAPRDKNDKISENDSDVKIVFAEELKELLSTIALKMIAEDNLYV
jgi:hypothetical protein